MKNALRLGLAISLGLAVMVGCSGGGTSIVGTWRRPGNSTQAEVTMVVSGTTSAGTATVVGISTNLNSDPPCTGTIHFAERFTATASTITFDATPGSGTYVVAGCTDPSQNMPQMTTPDDVIMTQAAAMSGSYTVSATQLVITNAGATTTFTRM